jgi:Mitochondrial branched-chain alpha-ketoacid dehydrogenase kinase
LPVRLAHRVKDLDHLPDKLHEMPSIQKVKNWYAQSFEVSLPCYLDVSNGQGTDDVPETDFIGRGEGSPCQGQRQWQWNQSAPQWRGFGLPGDGEPFHKE